MPKIYFITGASGTGKTTLVNRLQVKYATNNDWGFLHFDSITIPSTQEMIDQYGSVENWQKAKTEDWITDLIKNYTEKKVVIFEGQVNPHFIQEAFTKHNYTDYEIILLDCQASIMQNRLEGERNQPELFTDDMKNWLKYLRDQAKKLNLQIIDTSMKTPEKIILIFKNYFD